MSPSPAAGGHSPLSEITVQRAAMRKLDCGAIIHGCETRIIASSEEELLRAMDTHARVDHGLTGIPETLQSQIRRSVRGVEPSDLRD